MCNSVSGRRLHGTGRPLTTYVATSSFSLWFYSTVREVDIVLGFCCGFAAISVRSSIVISLLSRIVKIIGLYQKLCFELCFDDSDETAS